MTVRCINAEAAGGPKGRRVCDVEEVRAITLDSRARLFRRRRQRGAGVCDDVDLADGAVARAVRSWARSCLASLAGRSTRRARVVSQSIRTFALGQFPFPNGCLSRSRRAAAWVCGNGAILKFDR